MHLLLALCLVPVLAVPQEAPSSCGSWPQCRELALAAHERGEDETFHDLAWRAVQTRGRRDPDLLFLLARAQSASGRPHDALVTLQRLASELGVAFDIEDDEDFRRVRAMPGWPDLKALMSKVNAAPPPAAPPPSAAPADTPKAADRVATATTASSSRIEEVARFAAPRFNPGGLAYDAVSRRFVIGNLPERKLTIVAQGTNRSATLSGDAAQLLGVRAIEIDRRNGDLWVVSGGSSPNGDGRSSEVHRLQLISGRVLHVYSAAPGSGAAQFVDIAVAPGRGVLVLDATGPRLLRPLPDGRSLAHVADLPPGRATSLAPTDDSQTVYVAYDDRIERIDLAAGTNTTLRGGGAGPDLSGFTRLRWYRGSLVGVQEEQTTRRLIRLKLRPNGGRVSAEVLTAIESSSGPVTIDVQGNDLYYLVVEQPEAVIRRVTLR